MLALVLIMLVCVALGVGVVGYVMREARREGRGEFWTPEGEELIAGARRTSEKVRERREQLSRTAAERTKGLRTRPPERGVRGAGQGSAATAGGEEAVKTDGSGTPNGPDRRSPERPDGQRVVRDKVYEEPADDPRTGFRAAS